MTVFTGTRHESVQGRSVGLIRLINASCVCEEGVLAYASLRSGQTAKVTLTVAICSCSCGSDRQEGALSEVTARSTCMLEPCACVRGGGLCPCPLAHLFTVLPGLKSPSISASPPPHPVSLLLQVRRATVASPGRCGQERKYARALASVPRQPGRLHLIFFAPVIKPALAPECVCNLKRERQCINPTLGVKCIIAAKIQDKRR